MYENNLSLKKTTLILMVFTVITKLMGFSREIIISYFFGASKVSDAYLISLTIPGSLFVIVGVGITTGYIPMYSHIRKEKNEKAANDFTNDLINSILIITSFIIMMIYVFTRQIVKLFAYGFDSSTLALTVNFTRISVLGILCTGLVYVFNGYLNVKNKFLVPILMSFPFNLCIIASCFLGYYWNLGLLPMGNALADLVKLLFILPFAYRLGFRYRIRLDWRNTYLRQTLKLSLPIMIGASINQINIMIGKTIASKIIAGGISALNYANLLNIVVHEIFITSIVTVLFPKMSLLAAEEDKKGLRALIEKAIHIVNLFVLPATLGCLLFTRPIITLLFGRGAFDADAVRLTTSALFYYSLGMPAVGIREVLSRAFYAMQDTKTPMINAGIGFFGNIILSLLLTRFMGIGGLALANSTIAIVTAGMMYISLKKKLGEFIEIRKFSITSLKIITAALLMGLTLKLAYRYLIAIVSLKTVLAAVVLLGAASYFILLYLMKVEDITSIIRMLQKKLRLSSDVPTPVRRIQKVIMVIRKYSKIKTENEFSRRLGHNMAGYHQNADGYKKNSITEDINLVQSYIRTASNRNVRNSVGILLLTADNTAGFGRTLSYTLHQTLRFYHVYIIDYGVSDETCSFLKPQLKQQNNISYYRLQPGSGSATAVYYGMKLAFDDGMRYVWTLTDCDMPHPNALAVLMNIMIKSAPKTCLVSRKVSRFDSSSLMEIRNSEKLLKPIERITFPGFFLSRALTEEIGLPRKDLITYFEEAEYSDRIIRAGYPVYLVRDSFLLHSEKAEESKPVRLFGKFYRLPNRTRDQWYYYMRNGLLTASKNKKINQPFLKQHFRILLGVLWIYPGCFPAALTGYLHGKRGISGRKTR